MAPKIFTTSWDDGSILDLRIAELLSRHGLKGTFYIPKEFDGQGRGSKFSEYGRRLNEDEIRSLSLNHEVGAHSLSHRSLVGLSVTDLETEVAGSKKFIESIIAHPVQMFCLPRGQYDELVLRAIRDAGYLGVRTTEKLALSLPRGVSVLPVSVIVSPFPFRRVDAENYYWGRLLDPLRAYPFTALLNPRTIISLGSWQSFVRRFFKKAYHSGNYFHLYGHSWEIEKYNMWSELESFLAFVAGHQNVVRLTNGELIEQI